MHQIVFCLIKELYPWKFQFWNYKKKKNASPEIKKTIILMSNSFWIMYKFCYIMESIRILFIIYYVNANVVKFM